MNPIQRGLILIAIFGSVLWLVGLGIHLDNPTFFSEVKLLLLFGIGVITPLAMRLVAQPDRHNHLPRVFRFAMVFHPFVIVAVAISFLLEPGLIAALLAGFWLVQALLLALYGLSRLLPRPTPAIEELCLNFALLYVPVSGVWLLSYSAGYALLTFDSRIVILTAVHFVFISMGGLVIVGCIGRQLYGSSVWKVYRILAALALISPAMVAAGITFTQFSGRLFLEAGAVVMLASSFLMLALLCFYSTPQHTGARILIYLSCAALLITMSLALAYSLGRFTGEWSLSLEQMVRWHGWLNAIGFTFCGLVAWNLLLPVNRRETDDAL